MSYTHPLSILLAILLALAFVRQPAPADKSKVAPARPADPAAAAPKKAPDQPAANDPPAGATATDQTPPQGAPPMAVEHPEAVLTLPSGDVLTAADPKPFRLGELTLRLETLGVNASRADWWAEAVGNHAELVKVEQVTLPAGEATLALVSRTAPAAARSAETGTEYWLMVARPDPSDSGRKTVYAVVAQVSGDRETARQELLRLAEQWEIPEKPEGR